MKVKAGKRNGYRAASSIRLWENKYLIADLLCALDTPKRKEVYAIEVYNGTDTARVLAVFELGDYKMHAMERLLEDARFAAAKTHFLFKSLEEIKTGNFYDNWQFFDGTRAGLF